MGFINFEDQNFYFKFLKVSVIIVLALSCLIFILVILKNYYLNKQPNSQIANLIRMSNLANPFSNKTEILAQSIEEQKNVDEDFSFWENRIATKYPWRRKLPLSSDKYFVYFDFTSKKFIARLYPSQGDNSEQLKAEIIRRLKKQIGIELEKFSLDIDIWPKSSLAPY